MKFLQIKNNFLYFLTKKAVHNTKVHKNLFGPDWKSADISIKTSSNDKKFFTNWKKIEFGIRSLILLFQKNLSKLLKFLVKVKK